jgi:hypothetical protein
MEQRFPPLRKLKVGDRVRLVHFPDEYLSPHALHRQTRQLYRRLLARRRFVRVYYVDEMGLPWIQCQFRQRNGKWEYHSLLIGTESGWVKVKPRKRSLRR